MRRLDLGHYQVVGEAFVHGIMHGEAVTEDVKTMEVHLGNDKDIRVDAILLPRSGNKVGAEEAI
jgi:lipopolysaccharide export system protein LptA